MLTGAWRQGALTPQLPRATRSSVKCCFAFYSPLFSCARNCAKHPGKPPPTPRTPDRRISSEKMCFWDEIGTGSRTKYGPGYEDENTLWNPPKHNTVQKPSDWNVCGMFVYDWNVGSDYYNFTTHWYSRLREGRRTMLTLFPKRNQHSRFLPMGFTISTTLKRVTNINRIRIA